MCNNVWEKPDIRFRKRYREEIERLIFNITEKTIKEIINE